MIVYLEKKTSKEIAGQFEEIFDIWFGQKKHDATYSYYSQLKLGKKS